LRRLAELIGEPPAYTPAAHWPDALLPAG
ncbi:MAG: hypothetical protein QOH45_2407, partial [Pseudonocardiales bacterium]|nr:hypothetical protein [Pseudonocardiales bacterium]